MQGGLKGGIPTFSCGVLRARRPAEGVQPLADKKYASSEKREAYFLTYGMQDNTRGNRINT
jgi:hypothetical protein